MRSSIRRITHLGTIYGRLIATLAVSTTFTIHLFSVYPLYHFFSSSVSLFSVFYDRLSTPPPHSHAWLSLLLFPSPSASETSWVGVFACGPHQTAHTHSLSHTLTHGRLIKGIDPLNLYELQFVPAPHPVRHVRTYGAVCVCSGVVGEENASRRFWSTPLTSCERHSVHWQHQQQRQTHTHAHVPATSIHTDNTCRLACTHWK